MMAELDAKREPCPTPRSAVWLALGLRLLLLLAVLAVTADWAAFSAPDSRDYLALAEGLARRGSFAKGDTPEIIRTPGYPTALVPGVHLGYPVATALLLQAVLGCATLVLVHRIAWLLFRRRTVAALAALLYAVEPLSILYTNKLLTETLFTFLAMAFVLGLLRHLRSGGWWPLVWGAAALAAAIYVRPIAYPLAGLAFVGLVARAGVRRRERAVGVGQALAFGLVVLLCVLPWHLRNRRVAGYRGFSGISAVNLYFYHAAAVTAAVEGRPYYQVQREWGYHDDAAYLRRHPDQAGLSRAQRLDSLATAGKEILLEHPRVAAANHAQGMLRMLLDPGAVDYLKLFNLYPTSGGLLGVVVDRGLAETARMLLRERPLVFWSTLALGLLLGGYLLLALVGLFRLGAAGRAPGVAVVLVALYFLVISGGPQAECRFRHPIMPLICVFAAAGAAGRTRPRAENAGDSS
jgi:4-amino-4-deoxy-L-arabinose transferase-like glycosyltransferase